MSIATEPETLEEYPEALVTGREQQVAPHHDRAQQFANESEHGDAGQKFSAADVQSRSRGDHGYRDRDFSNLADLNAEKLSYVRSASHGHRRNGSAQGPQIDPSRHPSP